MMLVIIDLLYDRQGSDPVYEERFAGSTMAVDGHQRSVPIRMRPRAVRAATDQGQGATRRKPWADGARCRSAPRSPGLTASGRWTPSPATCWSPPTAPARRTSSRPWTITATGIRVTRTRPTKARGPRTAGPAFRRPARDAPRQPQAVWRGTGYRCARERSPGTASPRVRESGPARIRGPRLPAAGCSHRRPAGQEIWPVTGAPGGTSRHRPAAGRAGLGHAGRWRLPAGR